MFTIVSLKRFSLVRLIQIGLKQTCIFLSGQAKNIRCLSEEPRIGAHGKPVMFLHPKDCNGVLVELEQE